MWVELIIVLAVLAIALAYVCRVMVRVLKRMYSEEGLCDCSFCTDKSKKGCH